MEWRAASIIYHHNNAALINNIKILVARNDKHLFSALASMDELGSADAGCAQMRLAQKHRLDPGLFYLSRPPWISG